MYLLAVFLIIIDCLILLGISSLNLCLWPAGWGPHAYFQMLADSRNDQESNNANCLSVQPSEPENVYAEPQRHIEISRSNTRDGSLMLDEMESQRRPCISCWL